MKRNPKISGCCGKRAQGRARLEPEKDRRTGVIYWLKVYVCSGCGKESREQA